MEYVIYALVILNIAQLVFWSRQVQKLVDKLMSRNYAEYVQVNNPPLPTVIVEDDLVEETDVLNELNGMIGN